MPMLRMLCTLPAPAHHGNPLRFQGNTGNMNEGEGNTGDQNKGQGNTGFFNEGLVSLAGMCLLALARLRMCACVHIYITLHYIT